MLILHCFEPFRHWPAATVFDLMLLPIRHHSDIIGPRVLLAAEEKQCATSQIIQSVAHDMLARPLSMKIQRAFVLGSRPPRLGMTAAISLKRCSDLFEERDLSPFDPAIRSRQGVDYFDSPSRARDLHQVLAAQQPLIPH